MVRDPCEKMCRIFWVFILFKLQIVKGSNTGKEFFIGLLDVYNRSSLKIDIASYTNGHVNVYVPYLGINTTSPFNKTLSFTFNNRLALAGTRIERKSVFIKSDKDISVYATSLDNIDSIGTQTYLETYVSLPLDSLGNKYQIASYTPGATPVPSTFMAIAAYDNTLINVSFPNGTSTSKTLNSLDIYKEASPDSDLTGTLIQSSKPVSVISGGSCSYVISRTGNCQVLVEQLLPLNAFESQFIVPPIYNSRQFVVRILSGQSNNTVCVKDASFENCTVIGSTKWIESAVKRTALIVTSQEPVSVVQYKESKSYMTIIPGIRQFTNSYAFVAPHAYDEQQTYVAVTILSSAIHTLRLDGRSPADQIVDKANVPSPLNAYVVLTCNISSGYHVITSNETNVAFGLLVFAYGGTYDGAFAFPAGILIPSNKQLKQLMCYNCDDMSDLELCDTVQLCNPGELCIVQHGHSQYSSGCANMSLCSNAQTSHGRCLECCDGNYCNGRGCGDNGLVPRSQRGPMCYDCNHVLKPDQCKTVRPCFEDEVCSIEEFDWLGHSHFKLGCVAASCSAIEHGRSVPRCKSCCSEDFCNTNCTMSHGHGASIIG